MGWEDLAFPTDLSHVDNAGLRWAPSYEEQEHLQQYEGEFMHWLIHESGPWSDEELGTLVAFWDL